MRKMVGGTLDSLPLAEICFCALESQPVGDRIGFTA